MFGKKNTKSPKYRWAMARKITGYPIQYVTEHTQSDDPDVYDDVVIGKGGCISLKDDEVLVNSSSQNVFRCKVEEMDAWELMSGNGVSITAPDIEHSGRVRTIIVHYVYYRK
ncbi:MAG: hypothetical protein ILO68_02190 [Clostridia bacterium]|nr:hypothetical protein [Clostridia bacterium]